MGDRVGKQEADTGERQEECYVYGQHRQSTRAARALLQESDQWVQDERDQPGDDKYEQHLARRPRERPQRQQRDRQHHELHPTRHEHARGLGGRRLYGRRLLTVFDELSLGLRGRLRLAHDSPVIQAPTMGRVWLSQRRRRRWAQAT